MVVCSGHPMALAQGFLPRLPLVSQFESPALSPTTALRQPQRPEAEAMGRDSVSFLILGRDPPAYLLDTTGVPPPVSPPAPVGVGCRRGPMAISLAQEGAPVSEYLN
jgi:hypothetical protein